MSETQLCDAEAIFLTRLRERGRLAFSGSMITVASFYAPPTKVSLLDLERRGVIDRHIDAEGFVVIRPCDRLASFDWPHWRAETDGDRVTITVTLGDHSPLIGIFTFCDGDLDPKGRFRRFVDRCIEKIAKARELRANGKACECSNCEVAP